MSHGEGGSAGSAGKVSRIIWTAPNNIIPATLEVEF